MDRLNEEPWFRKIQRIFNEMSQYRKILLILMAVMVLGFGVATLIVGTRKGMAYGGSFLYFTQENGVRRYAGRDEGEISEFTVQPDGTIDYRWGDYTYGPYRVVEDPTAVPKGMSGCTGIEIRRGDEALFRGGCYKSSSLMNLYSEDGEMLVDLGTIGVGTASGTKWYVDGREISEYEFREPGLSTLAQLSLGPELTHRGSFALYLLVTLLAALNIVQILFPEMLFRLSLWGRVRDPEAAEPSDFYIAMEHIEWAVLAVMTAWLYWLALTVIN